MQNTISTEHTFVRPGYLPEKFIPALKAALKGQSYDVVAADLEISKSLVAEYVAAALNSTSCENIRAYAAAKLSIVKGEIIEAIQGSVLENDYNLVAKIVLGSSVTNVKDKLSISESAYYRRIGAVLSEFNADNIDELAYKIRERIIETRSANKNSSASTPT